MINEHKNKLGIILIYLMWIFAILFFVGLIIFSIYVWVVYGNLPPEEVPSWVHWLMLR